ncbi:hypothetical protein AB0I55_03320 [Actinocatenispora sera]|uniref:hypothetical protein n=1 Tax=Actinocatenispora sera TaxID=390989 RepID=UPI0033E9805F
MQASRRNTLRRAAIAALVIVVWLGWPVGSLIYRSVHQPPRPTPRAVPSVQVPTKPVKLGWTVAQARTAIAADRLARLPGAPAVLDEKRIRAALAHTKTRVIALPFAGLDTYRAYDKQVTKLAAAQQRHGSKLIIVAGLTVRVEPVGGAVTPSTMSEIRQVLTTHEMTEMVLTGIDDKSRNGDGPSRLPDAPAKLVDIVAAGLSAHRVYTAPGLPTVTATARWNDIADGPTLRLATLPPGAPDNLAQQLSARFPGDLIVVVRGQWTDLAGPDPRLQTAAVNGYYGQHFDQTARWGPPAANIGLLVAEYYGRARANAAVVEHPDRAADPLPVVLTWLPWIFAGTVGLLLAGTLALRWRLARRRRDRRRAEIAGRARLQARVAGTGARFVQLSRYLPDDDLLARAGERYRTARDLVTAGGDTGTAAEALDTADAYLARAAKLPSVPADAGETP